MTRRHLLEASVLLGMVLVLAAVSFALLVELAPAKTSVEAPTARQFATILEASANTYAAQHGDVRRLSNVHCVSPVSGRYLCSYVVEGGGPSTCHIGEMEWTPRGSYRVMRAGRVRVCSTLRAALDSLG